MPDVTPRRIIRIGVFYDGHYFSHVSNYYFFHHERRSRVSLGGLHAFLRDEIARREGVEPRRAAIVEAHYFRTRLAAADAAERDLLLKERQFEDVLIREGVALHHVPLVGQLPPASDAEGGPRREKGIGIGFALEIFAAAAAGRIDVAVLVAPDGDYVPLVRKLSGLGVRSAVLGWDFRFTAQDNEVRETRTSGALLAECTYPVLMSALIDDRGRRYDPLVKDLFLQPGPAAPAAQRMDGTPIPDEVATPGEIVSLQNGYGFLQPDDENEDDLFFFHLELQNAEFTALAVGDRVRYVKATNDRGPCAKRIFLVSATAPPAR